MSQAQAWSTTRLVERDNSIHVPSGLYKPSRSIQCSKRFSAEGGIPPWRLLELILMSATSWRDNSIHLPSGLATDVKLEL